MVYVLLAPGFEEIEALAPVDILRRAGVEVQTVGIQFKEVEGAHGITVTADISLDDLNREAMEMLVLPGGPGHTKLQQCADLIREAVERNCYLAAICAAPSVPGRLGLLRGREATCYPGYEKYLEGATLSDRPVVVSGKVITAKGPGVSLEFGWKLAEILKSKETADRVAGEMQWSR